MQSDIVQRLDDWRSEMQRTIKALESNPKFADVVEGNRAIHTTLGMAKTEILFSRTTIANQSEAMRASDAELARLTEALRNMADVVAVYAMQPPHPTRQRERLAQDQWDQIAQVVSEMLRAALKEQPHADA